MDGVSILEKIVAENGSCCWAKPSICKACPLSKVHRYESGRYMSCIELLGIDGLSEEEADKKYKEAAQQKLASMLLEEAIRVN